MGAAFEVMSFRATNPAALAATTPGTGDNATVRSFPFESGAYLEEIWAQEVTTGIVRVTSARLHDQAQAIRLRVSASGRPLLPRPLVQRIYPQDALTIQIQGGGAETDAAFLLFYYNDL